MQGVHLAAVLRLYQAGQCFGPHALGHGQHHPMPMGAAEQARLGHGAATSQAGRQVQTAHQPFVVHMGGDAHTGATDSGHFGQPAIAHGPVGSAQPHAAQQHRVQGKCPQGFDRVAPAQRPRRGLWRRLPWGHAPSTSARAFCTRAPEPVSSSGLRRSRWRRAKGATARKCSGLTVVCLFKAA